tara:strand:+ start:1969 stop:2397 length:429 start_codon:yes stop_codon:yes gene_type:complete
MKVIKTESKNIINLRHKVLRNGYPIEEVMFKEDELISSRHYAMICNEKIIACLTLFESEFDSKPAWQLRAMAVEEKHRGSSIGSQLLEFAMKDIEKNNILKNIWCNSRVTSKGFYKKFGFKETGESFVFGNAGKSIKMLRKI